MFYILALFYNIYNNINLVFISQLSEVEMTYLKLFVWEQ